MKINQPPSDRFKQTVLNRIISIIKQTPSATKTDLMMTQAELAELLNISPQQLSRLLREGNPTLDTIWDIAFALKVNPIELFEGTDLEKMNPTLSMVKSISKKSE